MGKNRRETRSEYEINPRIIYQYSKKLQYNDGINHFICWHSNRYAFMIKKVWQKYIDLIRKYPVFSVWVSWIEGVIVGVLLMYFLT